MRRKSTKIVVAIAAVAAIGVGGAVSTADNSLPNNSYASFGSSTIQGANATALSYDLSTDGDTIVTAHLTFTTNLDGRTVKAGFNTDVNLSNCDVDPFAGGVSTVTCDNLNQATDDADTFHVAVN